MLLSMHRKLLPFHHCVLLSLLLTHLWLSESFAARIPNSAPAPDVLDTVLPTEEEVPIDSLATNVGDINSKSNKRWVISVERLNDKSASGGGTINQHPSTGEIIGEGESYNYHHTDILDRRLRSRRRRIPSKETVWRINQEQEKEEEDNKVDGAQTVGMGDYLELSFNYDDDADVTISEQVPGESGEEDEEEPGGSVSEVLLEIAARPQVIANKWKRYLITGPTFDNCPEGTRMVRNECREVLVEEEG